jgi:ribokinase
MSGELLALVDILVLNETELGFLADVELSDSDEAARIIDVARRLQVREDQTICVTLGKRGVLALAGREEFSVSGRVVKAVDTTGAGDCFVGALAAQLAEGVALRTALAFANAAASISVQRMGAGPSMPTAAEVAAVIKAG